MPSKENPLQRREVSVRRAPRYVPFMILGGLAGFVAAAVIAFSLPGNPAYDAGAVFGFFLIACGIGGVLLGATTALILDRLSTRRARTAVLEAVPEAGTNPAGGVQPGPDGSASPNPHS